jgi:hypothetical protein
LVNLGPELDDFRDTAAVISQLDLVLCVDTAVAHLAGALGKRVWLMLPKAAEWRWLEGREDSPWYPTMRLFRQQRQGDWTDVIERIGEALQQLKRESAQTSALSPVAAPVPAAVAKGAMPQTDTSGHRAGLSAVAVTRTGLLQYLPDEPVIGASLRWYGELLQPQLDLLARMLRPGATILEIDSGVGAHAVALAQMIGGQGHLMLYESRPLLRQILRQNLAANRVGNATLMRRSETVDDLHLARLDVLKVNTGAIAMDVLAGAGDTLWRLRPSLFIAAADDPALAEPAARVKEFGYRCWRMAAAWFNPYNFNRRDDDIFAGRSALALVATPEEVEGDMAQDGCVEIS